MTRYSQWQAKRSSEDAIRSHHMLLGHKGFGVSELRLFDPYPRVAYADSDAEVIRLCQEADSQAKGVYIGVQPRPLHFFEFAPNQWVSATGGHQGNCARDKDIEYWTTLYFDIDVNTALRAERFASSLQELTYTLRAAQLLSNYQYVIDVATIACTGNGHCVLVPITPMPLYSREDMTNVRNFCNQLVHIISGRTIHVRFDPVFNASRVMRMIGTKNGKGQEKVGRCHRTSFFVTSPIVERSSYLQTMIHNMESTTPTVCDKKLTTGIKCNLENIEKCEFIKWCRCYPNRVSEPHWFGLITNLAWLEGGPDLIHEISRLDNARYSYGETQQRIERVLISEYRPIRCQFIVSGSMSHSKQGSFYCSKLESCPVRAPMYITALKTRCFNQGDSR